jgi:hypothetical protein
MKIVNDFFMNFDPYWQGLIEAFFAFSYHFSIVVCNGLKHSAAECSPEQISENLF